MNHLYCYEKDSETVKQWRLKIPKEWQLFELKRLEEMFFSTLSDGPAVLMLHENSLNESEMQMLRSIADSFPFCKILVLSHFENLKWCVEVLKIKQVDIEPEPKTAMEFKRLLKRYLIKSYADQDASKLYLKDLFQQSIEANLNNRTPLAKATEEFLKKYVRKIQHLCGEDLDRTSKYLKMPKTELISRHYA